LSYELPAAADQLKTFLAAKVRDRFFQILPLAKLIPIE
jgi:hypothetical protein